MLRTRPDNSREHCGTARVMAAKITVDEGGLAAAAAAYRLEACVLEARARATPEATIRDEYLALARRWSLVAASLDVEAHR